MAYKVLAPELQVLEAIGEFHDPNGNFAGYDHRSVLYFEGETVADDKVSPLIKDAIEDEDNPLHDYYEDKLEKVGGSKEQLDLARRIGLPFDDYDSLSEEDVIAAFRVLSGPLIAAVKEYEAVNEGRERILEYNAGRREAEDDRVRGDKGLVSELQDADEKPLAAVQTRDVSEDGVVTPGEGYTGSDPDRPKGAAAEAAESETVAKAGSGSKSRTRKTKAPSTTSADADAGSGS